MKNIGRLLILSALCAATWLVFRDSFSYWVGVGSTRICSLDVSRLQFLRDDRFRFGGPGVHFKEVKYYRTPEGDEVAIFQPIDVSETGVFVRGMHRIFHEKGFEEVTTYEPFIAWSYILKRSAVLSIIYLLIFALAGLVLKITGRS